MINFLDHVITSLADILSFTLIEGITIGTIFMYNILLIVIFTAFTRR